MIQGYMFHCPHGYNIETVDVKLDKEDYRGIEACAGSKKPEEMSNCFNCQLRDIRVKIKLEDIFDSIT